MCVRGEAVRDSEQSGIPVLFGAQRAIAIPSARISKPNRPNELFFRLKIESNPTSNPLVYSAKCNNDFKEKVLACLQL